LKSLFFKIKVEKKIKVKKLEKNPQVKGITLKTRIATPKKPNSARRPIAKVKLMNLNSLLSHIPGIGHNLRKHSMVLVRGGNVKDLPGVSYKCIRGVYDLAAVQNRTTRRSIYGVKKPENLKLKLRRKFRQN
jgi:small subunit ribosomal protein S12